MNFEEPFSVARLLARVAQQAGRPLGLVVHVGAGPAALEDHAQTRARRLVLIEGDPDTAAELQKASRQRQPAIELVAEAVAPEAGTLSWRRYNLTTLNGPLDAGALRSIYPRLREGVPLQRTATAFDALLQRIAAAAQADAVNLLLLDVPGQEHGLLRSANPATLRGFQWIGVHGSRQGPGAQGDATATTRAWLTQVHYPLVDADDAAQGIWPWSLHRFDANAQQRGELKSQVAAALSRSRALEDEVRALRTERDALAKEKAALLAARDEQTRAARDAKQQVDQIGAELVDTGARYGLLQEELVKAEAQIELIADLLLRDPPR